MAEMQDPLAPSVTTAISQKGPRSRAALSAVHSLPRSACASALQPAQCQLACARLWMCICKPCLMPDLHQNTNGRATRLQNCARDNTEPWTRRRVGQTRKSRATRSCFWMTNTRVNCTGRGQETTAFPGMMRDKGLLVRKEDIDASLECIPHLRTMPVDHIGVASCHGYRNSSFMSHVYNLQATKACHTAGRCSIQLVKPTYCQTSPPLLVRQ